MTSTSVNRLFTSQARLAPEALALSSGDTRLTYGELERCANHLARRLVDSGVRPRDRVLLCLPRSVDAVIAMLAIMKTGAAFVPVDPAYSDAIKRGYASDSGARPCAQRSSIARPAPAASRNSTIACPMHITASGALPLTCSDSASGSQRAVESERNGTMVSMGIHRDGRDASGNPGRRASPPAA